jgi:hypothetical protein
VASTLEYSIVDCWDHGMDVLFLFLEEKKRRDIHVVLQRKNLSLVLFRNQGQATGKEYVFDD